MALFTSIGSDLFIRLLWVFFIVSTGALAQEKAVIELVSKKAQTHGIPEKIAHAVVKAESGYQCSARNKSGAVGIMQTLPSTARSMGVHGPLTDCHNGLEAGMRYLSLIVRTHGISCESLSLYERGLGARPRCTAYGRKIMASQ